MKILKNGTVPQPKLRIFRGTCGKCGAVVECDENEASVTAERRPNGAQLWTIKCPFKLLSYRCDATINLEETVFRGDDDEPEMGATAYPSNYPVNYGKEVPVKEESELAKKFRAFFEPPPIHENIFKKAEEKLKPSKKTLAETFDELFEEPIITPEQEAYIRRKAQRSAQRLAKALETTKNELSKLADEL